MSVSPGASCSTARRMHLRRTGASQNLDARQVNVFLLMDTARLSVGSANNVTTALRALLRFFYVRGSTRASLSGCVPRGGNWRDSCPGPWT